jgi:hypothetical protein
MTNPIKTQLPEQPPERPTQGVPCKSIEQLAAEQGIKPFDFEEAWKAAEGIWPEEENIDDFTDWLRNERKSAVKKAGS